MARRSKTSLENDIERTRWEGKWENIPRLVDQLSTRTTSESSIDALKKLLISESQLEIYLRENPLGTTDAAKAKVSLEEVVSDLKKLVSQDKLQKSDRTQEALLLLAMNVLEISSCGLQLIRSPQQEQQGHHNSHLWVKHLKSHFSGLQSC